MKLNISFYLDKTDTLYQVYLSKYECTCGTFSLSWDSRMINAIDSSDNFFFFFLFCFSSFSFFCPLSLLRRWRGRANEAYTLFPITVFASRVYNSRIVGKKFLLQRACSSFHEGSCFLRASVSSFALWCVKLSLRSCSCLFILDEFSLFFPFKLSLIFFEINNSRGEGEISRINCAIQIRGTWNS